MQLASKIKNLELKTILEEFVLISFSAFIVSVSLGEFFLYLSFVVYIYLLYKKKIEFKIPKFFYPLLLYVLFSFVSSFFSYIPEVSLINMKEGFLILGVLPAFYVFSEDRSLFDKVKKYVLPFLLLTFVVSIYQFIREGLRGDGIPRAHGFLSHYMTLAGISLIFSLIFFGELVFKKKSYIKNFIPFFMFSTILLLTLTRSSWLGYVVGILFIVGIKKPKFVVSIPLIILIVYLLSPTPVKERIKSFGNFNDVTFKQRVYMAKRAHRIIKEKWLWGVGPNMIPYTYTIKRLKVSYDEKEAPHLHNNLLQIWAERGILALISWIAFIVVLFLEFIKSIRNLDKGSPFYYLSYVGLGILIAFFTAGLFEYNFGDSEVSTVFLYTMSMIVGVLDGEKKKIV